MVHFLVADWCLSDSLALRLVVGNLYRLAIQLGIQFRKSALQGNCRWPMQVCARVIAMFRHDN